MNEVSENAVDKPAPTLVKALDTFQADVGRIVRKGDVLSASDPIINGRETSFAAFYPEEAINNPIAETDPDNIVAGTEEAGTEEDDAEDESSSEDDAAASSEDDAEPSSEDDAEADSIERPKERDNKETWALYVASFGIDTFDAAMAHTKAELIERSAVLEAVGSEEPNLDGDDGSPEVPSDDAGTGTGEGS